MKVGSCRRGMKSCNYPSVIRNILPGPETFGTPLGDSRDSEPASSTTPEYTITPIHT